MAEGNGSNGSSSHPPIAPEEADEPTNPGIVPLSLQREQVDALLKVATMGQAMCDRFTDYAHELAHGRGPLDGSLADRVEGDLRGCGSQMLAAAGAFSADRRARAGGGE